LNSFLNSAGFRHVEVPGQPLCGSPQYHKEVLFKIKEILLSGKKLWKTSIVTSQGLLP